jgi:hypothetical protein
MVSETMIFFFDYYYLEEPKSGNKNFNLSNLA